jgi:hypothetical protein
MIRTGNLEHPVAQRAVAEGRFRGHLDYLISSPDPVWPAPQGFLVQQNGDWELPPHFHREDQFQVVVNGGGMLGKHRLEPLTVHYASGESGYGPITAGPHGLWYFTLRATTDPGGAWWMPESRAQMTPNKAKRQATSQHIAVSESAALFARREASVETVLEQHSDGAAAWLLRVPPRAEVVPPKASGPHGGRFYVVAAGQMHVGDERLPQYALAFATPDEELQARAGAAGLELLVLQYARRAQAAQTSN